jgi:LacI family transcriptional regulator
MGGTAAHMLNRMLLGANLADTRILVPPAGINVLVSSQHQALYHPRVEHAPYESGQ